MNFTNGDRYAACVGIVIGAISLVACDARVELKSEPVTPKTVTVTNSADLPSNVTIHEVCIDGVTYLVTDKGGISPKVNTEMASAGYISMHNAPFFRCK